MSPSIHQLFSGWKIGTLKKCTLSALSKNVSTFAKKRTRKNFLFLHWFLVLLLSYLRELFEGFKHGLQFISHCGFIACFFIYLTKLFAFWSNLCYSVNEPFGPRLKSSLNCKDTFPYNPEHIAYEHINGQTDILVRLTDWLSFFCKRIPARRSCCGLHVLYAKNVCIRETILATLTSGHARG